MKKTNKGFTLVELLVVIAILAILATVSVVGYTAFISKANDSVALQELTQLRDYIVAEDLTNDEISIDTLTQDQLNTLKANTELTGTVTIKDGVVTYVLENEGTAYWVIETNTLTTEVVAEEDAE